MKFTKYRIPPNTYKFFIFIIVALVIVLGVFIFSWKTTTKPITISAPNNVYDKTLVVAADYDYEPYSFIDETGNISGYDIELIYAIADKMKVNVELKLLKWSDACQAVISGEADLLMGLDYKPEAVPEYTLSMPMQNDPFVAFGKKGFSKISELQHKKLAVLENSGSISAFIKPYKLEEHTAYYSTYSDAFNAVINGECDYVISMYSVGRRALANIDNPSIKGVGPALIQNSLCIGAKAGNNELIEAANAAILELTSDGTIDGLTEKWLGTYVQILDFGEFLSANIFFVIIIIAVIIIICFILYQYFNNQKFKAQIREQEILSRGLEYQKLLYDATKVMYQSIYEFDITHDALVGENTKSILEISGMDFDSPYSVVYREYGKKVISNEYLQGFLSIFSPENILDSFNNKGVNSLSFECLFNEFGKECWTRTTARIFHWDYDNSVRMITFRQNIDNEKKRELALIEKSKRDPLTNLYNRSAEKEYIEEAILTSEPMQHKHVFILLDIDKFKNINDSFGHTFGDFVLTEFSKTISSHFQTEHLTARMGGDEFAVFIKNVKDINDILNEIELLTAKLQQKIAIDSKECTITSSIGVSVYPRHGISYTELFDAADKALYQAKNEGRNRFKVL